MNRFTIRLSFWQYSLCTSALSNCHSLLFVLILLECCLCALCYFCICFFLFVYFRRIVGFVLGIAAHAHLHAGLLWMTEEERLNSCLCRIAFSSPLLCLKKIHIQPIFLACTEIMCIQIEGITLSEGITQVQ